MDRSLHDRTPSCTRCQATLRRRCGSDSTYGERFASRPSIESPAPARPRGPPRGASPRPRGRTAWRNRVRLALGAAVATSLRAPCPETPCAPWSGPPPLSRPPMSRVAPVAPLHSRRPPLPCLSPSPSLPGLLSMANCVVPAPGVGSGSVAVALPLATWSSPSSFLPRCRSSVASSPSPPSASTSLSLAFSHASRWWPSSPLRTGPPGAATGTK